MPGLFKKLTKPFREPEMEEPAAIPDTTPLRIARGVDHAVRGELFGVTSVCAALKTAIEGKAVDGQNATEPLMEQLMHACDTYKYSLNNFAEYLKLLAGLSDTIYEAVSIRTLMQDILNDTRGGETKEKALIVTMQVDTEIPEQLAGDKSRIGLIIWNLLHHASESADARSRISIAIYRKGQDDWVVEIVRESGKAIDLDRFFDLTEIVGLPSKEPIAANLELFITRYLTVNLLKGAIGVSMNGSSLKYVATLPYL